MAAGTAPRKQAKALLFLAMLAVGQVDAVSNTAAAAGIATLAIAAHGVRDDGSWAISVHSAGHQVLANDEKRGLEDLIRTYNQSLMEAKPARDCLPKDTQGWVKLGLGKGNLYMAQVPFVGVVLAADACAKAAQSRCAAGKVLRDYNKKAEEILNAKPEGQLQRLATEADIPKDEAKPTLKRGYAVNFEDMLFQDIAVLQCKKGQADHGVVEHCVLGFALASAAQAANLATAGTAAAVTAPMLYAADVTKHVAQCYDATVGSCGYADGDKGLNYVEVGSGADVQDDFNDKGSERTKKWGPWISECKEKAKAAAREAMDTVSAAAEEMVQNGGGLPMTP